MTHMLKPPECQDDPQINKQEYGSWLQTLEE